jgi:toxin ParE1/3/4
LALLDTSMHDLADNPGLGRDCSDIRAGYHRYRVGKHILFYRQLDPDQIEIVRILHERMDVEARLSGS